MTPRPEHRRPAFVPAASFLQPEPDPIHSDAPGRCVPHRHGVRLSPEGWARAQGREGLRRTVNFPPEPRAVQLWPPARTPQLCRTPIPSPLSTDTQRARRPSCAPLTRPLEMNPSQSGNKGFSKHHLCLPEEDLTSLQSSATGNSRRTDQRPASVTLALRPHRAALVANRTDRAQGCGAVLKVPSLEDWSPGRSCPRLPRGQQSRVLVSARPAVGRLLGKESGGQEETAARRGLASESRPHQEPSG